MSSKTFEWMLTQRNDILPIREHYLHELQDFAVYEDIFFDKTCEFYQVKVEDYPVGYGVLLREGSGFGTVREFYLLPSHRLITNDVFRAFIELFKAKHLSVRTNDRYLLSIFYEFCSNPSVFSAQFQHIIPTHFSFPNLTFRPATIDDKDSLHALFTKPESDPFHWTDENTTEHYIKDESFWILEDGSHLLGVGVMYRTEYQPQYMDIGMVVPSEHRRNGYGTYLVQEITKICKTRNLVPSAGCIADNLPSRKTLEKAGYYAYDRYLLGDLMLTQVATD